MTPTPKASGKMNLVRGKPLEPLTVTAWALMLNTVATSVLGLAFWVVASRLYSPQELGENAALVSAMILLSTVAQLDLGMGIARLLPQVRQRRWRPVLGAYAVTAVIGCGLSAAFLALAPRLSNEFDFLVRDAALGWALIGGVVLWNIFALQDAVLTSARWAVAVPVGNAVFGVVKIALMAWLAGRLVEHGVFFGWLAAMVLVLVPMNMLIFARVLPSARIRGLPQAASAVPLADRRRVVRYLGTDYAAALLSQGSTALLPLLVVLVLGRTDNAYFYMAFLVAGAAGALAQSLSISLLVEGAYDEAELASLARRTGLRYLRVIAPGVVLLVAAAPLVLTPFGDAYVANATTLMRLLLVGTAIHAVIVLYMAVERLRARVSRVLFAEAALVVLIISGALAGMRANGLVGLGQAYVASEVIVAVVVAPRLWRIIRPHGAHTRGGHRDG